MDGDEFDEVRIYNGEAVLDYKFILEDDFDPLTKNYYVSYQNYTSIIMSFAGPREIFGRDIELVQTTKITLSGTVEGYYITDGADDYIVLPTTTEFVKGTNGDQQQ